LSSLTLLALAASALCSQAQSAPQTRSSHPVASVTGRPAGAQSVKLANPALNPDVAEKPKISDVVKVTIVSSRGTVSHDGSYGVFADIQNISPDPLELRASELVLVVQPEVSHPKPCVDWASAIFPTQNPAISVDPITKDAMIRVLPNEHYTVFWDLSPRPPQKNGMCPVNGRLSDLLGFVPGDYAFTVEGIARSISPNTQTDVGSSGAGRPSAADSDKNSAHTFTETTNLKVGLSLGYTAIAAFFGGLLAYLVVFLQPNQDFDKWRPSDSKTGRAKILAVWLRNALAAGFLAASVTIIASRLSDTQFPVKVSVSDVWGALTIGFVSYFAGSKFIQTLANRFISPPTIPANSAVPPAVSPTLPAAPTQPEV
jgi:hypothetical protein